MRNRTSIIIPVFNQAALTGHCLSALVDQNDSEIVVVDDASTDATARVLQRFHGRVKVIRHETNLGFATSCNDGATAASARDYLVLLNNDTVPQPGWLEALVRYADEHPEAAVVGAKLLYPDGTVQHAGVVICQDLYPRHIYSGFPADHPAVSRSRRFQIVTGACMLVRRHVFEEAGGFDPAFRNGFEDVDLCLRLVQRGHEIHYCAESVVYHLESVSPGRFKNDQSNLRLYRERWLPRVKRDDVSYYLDDGLLQFTYEGRYPVALEVSPMLAAVEEARRTSSLEPLLQQRSREIAELRCENTRLALELGRRPGDSAELRYQQLRRRTCEVVQQVVPAGATVLVVTKGDSALLDFSDHHGCHFPQTAQGAYAGHHPASGAEAVAALECWRGIRAVYLVIPATFLWWLDFYKELRTYLETNCARLPAPGDVCVIYQVSSTEDLIGEGNCTIATIPASSCRLEPELAHLGRNHL